MWSKVNELSGKGLKICQISLLTGIHRDTVRKYLSISEEEYERILNKPYHNRQKKLSTYASEVESWLKECPYLTSPQILDRLKENHPSMPEVSDKTV